MWEWRTLTTGLRSNFQFNSEDDKHITPLPCALKSSQTVTSTEDSHIKTILDIGLFNMFVFPGEE